MSNFRIYLVYPWLLLLLVPLLLLAFWPVMKLPKVRRFTINRKLSLILHSVILVLLVALLADATIYRDKDEINTILLADLSASTEESYDAIYAYAEELAALADDKNRIGVVVYAKDALYAAELSKEGLVVTEALAAFEQEPEKQATNLEEALYYAESLLDDKENQRIIVLSDGLQTDGDALAAAKVMAERGVQIDAVCLPARALGFEMQINSLSHKKTSTAEETITLTAVVQSNHEASAELRFMDNGSVISRRIVSIKEGLTEFTADFTPDSLGIHEISAQISPVEDDIRENNTYYSWLEIGGKGNLLLIDGTGRESMYLNNLLSEEYSVTEIAPEEAEGYMNQLAAYQGVILMNVSNGDLPEGFDKALEIYVEKYGGGVLTSGGGNTYAYGSMTDTAFEDLLPVTLEKGEEQTTAMMIVVDTSSSMQGTNHRMAIQGTMQCIETLAETDYVGVLTFDRSVTVIYDLTSMAYMDDILSAVEQIELGRGTRMTDAMQEAYDQLKDFEADNKHVIVLSDGEPQDSGYIRVVRQMAANGITVSAIAVGAGADHRIMQVIAETGGGNYYNAASVNDLPDIMVEEAIAAIDSYRQTGTFPIAVASYSTLLAGVETETLPTMSGYTTTFLKKNAEQFLTVNGGEPLYVQWDYGLGRVGSFTADLRGSDSEYLFESENGKQLIRNMIKGVVRTDGAITALKVDVTPKNQQAAVEVSAKLSGRESLKTTVLTPDGTEQLVDTVLSTRGTYTGSFDSTEPGVYTVTVTHLDNDGTMLDFTQVHTAVSYSKEYNGFSAETGEELLSQVCRETGGKMAYTVANVATYEGELLEQALDPTIPMLVLILVLFLADIAVRKFRLKRK